MVAHLVGWLLFFSLIVGFLSRAPLAGSYFNLKLLLSVEFISFGAIFLFIFYLNKELLFPKLFLHKRYISYALSGLALLVVVALYQPFDKLISHDHHPQMQFQPQPPHMPGPPMQRNPALNDFRPQEAPMHFDINSLILFLAIWSLSTALPGVEAMRNIEKRALLAETERKNAELSFLKAQINPHFLFNTLNNLYAMAITQNEHTADGIIKLSNIMRYVIDDVQQDFVPLEKEIAYIEDYIDLQRVRLGQKTQIDYQLHGQTEGKTIVPLVLMTFIENAFKHGISSHQSSTIVIRISVRAEGIAFYCSNAIFENKQKPTRVGKGIENVRKRLEYFYENRHSLHIEQQNQQFEVRLLIGDEIKTPAE